MSVSYAADYTFAKVQDGNLHKTTVTMGICIVTFTLKLGRLTCVSVWESSVHVVPCRMTYCTFFCRSASDDSKFYAFETILRI